MPSPKGSMYVARLADMGDNELTCHAYGHAWNPNPAEKRYDAKVDQVVLTRTLECLRCPKIRTDTLDQHTHQKIGRSHYTEVPRSRVLETLQRGRQKYQAELIRRELNRARFAKAKRFTAS